MGVVTMYVWLVGVVVRRYHIVANFRSVKFS